MTDEVWYYCDAEKDPDRCDGPVSVSALAALIRSGGLPYDVLVSTTKTDWQEADAVELILRAIPLDRERIVREFIEYGEVEDPEAVKWGWASARMYNILEGAPELAWELIVELIERAPSDRSLEYFAAAPLEDLLSEDGPAFVERVEQRAIQNDKFRRALKALRRLGMTDEVWRRVQVVAGR